MNIIKSGEGILFSLAMLLVALIMLYGLAHLIIRFTPGPVNTWVSGLVSKSTPGGWGINN